MTRYLPRSTPAVLLLIAALFLSAAGGAVAGSQITGKQIKNNTVTTKDIKDGSLATKDLSTAAKAALTYELEYVVVAGAPTLIPQGSTNEATAECPSGTQVIGGEVVMEDPANGNVVDSGPMTGSEVGWFVAVANVGPTPQLVTAKAHCANLG